ncbi:MAG: hypothetical protein QF475_03190 [Candidatus Undinarchaeales archaeon]|jgi:hypothetical protein|nr:hypothetical protein [Candidatus Undinarchaeales archaeon]
MSPKKKTPKKSIKKTSSKKKSVKEPPEFEDFITQEEKEEYIEEQLEDIGEAIEEELDESLKNLNKKEEPVAVFVKDKETAKDIKRLRKTLSSGLETTQKGIVVFYEQASEAGNRIRGFTFMLLGISFMFMGFFAKDIDFVTFKEILVSLTNTISGRIIVCTIGFTVFAYGSRKFLKGLMTPFLEKMFPKKKKYVQKKLV